MDSHPILLAPAPPGVAVLGPAIAGSERVLTPQALAFVADLERRFGGRRRQLLARRKGVQMRLDAGERPVFADETRELRQADWKIAEAPHDLRDRRVEITGPVDRKMIINALNSGANVFMADFEDSNAPTFANLVEGQANLQDAVRRTIRFVQPDTGKEYRLAERTATLVVRPRGWHLEEKHVLVDGEPCSASLFDFALYFFHNAGTLVANGTGPYFYLPKLESRLEARLWNDVFLYAQETLGLPRGTIRATVLIETILAAFEMDEILWELREHSSGLNCGRWDYIFSFIKKFRADPSFVLPDRGLVTMDQGFLRDYSLLLVKTCHRRGAHAMGGMAAQIPIREDAEKNAAAIAKVRADKRREAEAGHDGTWVAHPGLVAVAREEFDRVLGARPNQLDVLRPDVRVGAADLLTVPAGPITEKGLRTNLEIGVRYLQAWLGGNGCVPIHHLMEDAATAEISRAQVWQWQHHGARLADGRRVDVALVRAILAEEVAALRKASVGDSERRLDLAAHLTESMCTSPEMGDFLTLPAYELILTLA
ncbi:MAG TPA: malate synthase A [Planctomycetota bacterium]|nr:malate synthase A [Planctomycetota bacterium]